MASKILFAVLAVLAFAYSAQAASIVELNKATDEILREAGLEDVADLIVKLDKTIDNIVNLTCIYPQVDRITDAAGKLDLDTIGDALEEALMCLDGGKKGPVTEKIIIKGGKKGFTGPCADGKHMMTIKATKPKGKKVPVRGLEDLLTKGLGLEGLGLKDLSVKLADLLYDLLGKGGLLGILDVNKGRFKTVTCDKDICGVACGRKCTNGMLAAGPTTFTGFKLDVLIRKKTKSGKVCTAKSCIVKKFSCTVTQEVMGVHKKGHSAIFLACK